MSYLANFSWAFLTLLLAVKYSVAAKVSYRDLAVLSPVESYLYGFSPSFLNLIFVFSLLNVSTLKSFIAFAAVTTASYLPFKVPAAVVNLLLSAVFLAFSAVISLSSSAIAFVRVSTSFFWTVSSLSLNLNSAFTSSYEDFNSLAFTNFSFLASNSLTFASIALILAKASFCSLVVVFFFISSLRSFNLVFTSFIFLLSTIISTFILQSTVSKGLIILSLSM